MWNVRDGNSWKGVRGGGRRCDCAHYTRFTYLLFVVHECYLQVGDCILEVKLEGPKNAGKLFEETENLLDCG